VRAGERATEFGAHDGGGTLLLLASEDETLVETVPEREPP
jgi:hypothetical protein